MSIIEDKYYIMSQTDNEGVITNVSKAFCTISGYTKEELIGKKHNIVRHPDNDRSLFVEMWATITSGKAWFGEIKNRSKDGQVYWVDSVIEPLLDDTNAIVGYKSLRFNITDRKTLEFKNELLLVQSKQAAMGEMLQMISHQWRQPLTSIVTILSKMKMKNEMGLLSNTDFNSDYRRVKSVVYHLSNTIEMFQDYFRKNEQPIVFIYELFDGISKIMAPIFEKNEIEFVLKCSDTKHHIDGRLSQVILNIYQNAVDALMDDSANENKKITTTIFFDKNRKIEILICDNAKGIDEANIEKIFTPYFSTKSKNGSGLGLYMSKDIVENLIGGTLEIHNTHKGACFTIIVPCRA